MEGRRIRVKAAAATTLALTGGYLLMEGDFKTEKKRRRVNDLLIRRPFPFTRVTRRVVQPERYGDPGGDLNPSPPPPHQCRCHLRSRVAGGGIRNESLPASSESGDKTRRRRPRRTQWPGIAQTVQRLSRHERHRTHDPTAVDLDATLNLVDLASILPATHRWCLAAPSGSDVDIPSSWTNPRRSTGR